MTGRLTIANKQRLLLDAERNKSPAQRLTEQRISDDLKRPVARIDTSLDRITFCKDDPKVVDEIVRGAARLHIERMDNQGINILDSVTDRA